MAVTIPSKGAVGGRMTLVYEFFDSRVLDRLWFIAVSDGSSVQLMPPTFHSERAARIFERCVLDYPSGVLLTIDGQLELARRIEKFLLTADPPDGLAYESLCVGLPVEQPAPTIESTLH